MTTVGAVRGGIPLVAFRAERPLLPTAAAPPRQSVVLGYSRSRAIRECLTQTAHLGNSQASNSFVASPVKATVQTNTALDLLRAAYPQ